MNMSSSEYPSASATPQPRAQLVRLRAPRFKHLAPIRYVDVQAKGTSRRSSLELARSLIAAATISLLSACGTLNPAAVWRNEPVSLVKGNGDLVKIYHGQLGASPMNEQDVFFAVATDSSSWYAVRQAQQIKAEPNSILRKSEMDSWYKDFLAESAKSPRGNLVAFLIGVQVQPFDFSHKLFNMCIDTQESCAMRKFSIGVSARSGQLPMIGGDQYHLVFKSGRYTLRVTVNDSQASFSQGGSGNRDLEDFFVRTHRRPTAFGIARIDDVEQMSEKHEYVINATLIAVDLKTTEFIPNHTPDYFWSNYSKLDLTL